MNPFNQSRFRGEHELGREYADIRKAIENLADIKLVADNIKQLRSGNIELDSSGSVLKWKYVNEEEWHDLVDLQVLLDGVQNTLNGFSDSLDDLEQQLDNFNGIVSDIQNTLVTLNNRVEALETAGG